MSKKQNSEWDAANRGRGNWLSLLLLGCFLISFYQCIWQNTNIGITLKSVVEMTHISFSKLLFSEATSGGSVKRQAPATNSTSNISGSTSSSAISSSTLPATTSTSTSSPQSSTTISLISSVTLSSTISSLTTIQTTSTSTTATLTTSTLSKDDDGMVVDPRTPPGTATFLYPVKSAKNYTVQKSGTVMPIVWEFKDVIVKPKLLTLQVKVLDPSIPAEDQQGAQTSKGWTSIATNFSLTDHYDWLVNVPEGDGYLLRLFDSNLGPTGIQAGRLQTSMSNKFAVYLSTGVSIGPNPFAAASLARPDIIAWITVACSFLIVCKMLWD